MEYVIFKFILRGNVLSNFYEILAGVCRKAQLMMGQIFLNIAFLWQLVCKFDIVMIIIILLFLILLINIYTYILIIYQYLIHYLPCYTFQIIFIFTKISYTKYHKLFMIYYPNHMLCHHMCKIMIWLHCYNLGMDNFKPELYNGCNYLSMLGLKLIYARNWVLEHIYGLMQERRNSIANALELRCCKKDVTPLLTHWSYVFLALTHCHIMWLSMSLPLWPIWPWHEGSGQFHSNTMTILLRICNSAKENKTLGPVSI